MSDNLPNDFQRTLVPTIWTSVGEPASPTSVDSIEQAVATANAAAAAATAAAAQSAAILAAIQAGNFPGGGGTDPTPDATAGIKGKIKLAGDLGGTADLPTVPGIVKDTGDLLINGNKAFSQPLTIVNGSTAQHAVSKSQFEAAAALKLLTQTISAIWTFSADPVFNNGAIPQAKIVNLVTDLAAKALSTDLTALTAIVTANSSAITTLQTNYADLLTKVVPTLYINYTTGAWPARTVPAGYTTPGFVIWWSLGFIGTPTPPPGAIFTTGVGAFADLWMRDYQ